MHRQAPMEVISITHQGNGQELRFFPRRSGKAMHEQVSKLWGQGLIISAANIVITEEDVDLPAGNYSVCPGAHLICP